MWGPQSAAPGPGASPRSRRRFTLADANRALPLVERVVRDIVRAHAEATAAQSRVTELPAAEQPAARADLDRRLERLEDLVDELAEVGCELKDYRTGLVDFTGRHRGRDVCLCWKLGEPAVDHWHEMTAGFAGRQPAATLREGE